MASITKRGDSYRIRVLVGRDLNGKQVYETTTFRPSASTPKKIEKEVIAFASEFEKRVKDGKIFTGEKLTFQEFSEEHWYHDWAEEHLTTSVLEGYVDILNRRIYPALGMMKLSEIRPLHIKSIYSNMKEQGFAVKTIKRTHTVLNSVMRYAYRMEVIDTNPCDRVELPKNNTDTSLHYFTLEQSQAFLDFMDKEYPVHYGRRKRTDSRGETYNVADYTVMEKIHIQWRCFFDLAIKGGFRRAELLAITWNDVDFEKHTISINKAFAKTKNEQIVKGPKTVAGIRKIAMPIDCFERLSQWKKEQKELSLRLITWKGFKGRQFDNNYVFIQLDTGEAMSIDSPSKKFKKILKRYNDSCINEEDKLPEIRLHDLRHTSATLMISNGVDIETASHRLGHSKASITLDIYAHHVKEVDKTASDLIENLFENRA